MRQHSLLLCLATFMAALPLPLAAQKAPKTAPSTRTHNVIIVVADGLRRDSVTAADMPTFLKLRTEGVDFSNSHSVFPTFTTANASVIATGHVLGDTGDFSNVVYPGIWLAKPDDAHATGSVVPFLENDEILADMNLAFAGNYLGHPTLLSLARAKGYSVASIGKLGPTAIQQVDAVGWNQLNLLDSHGAIIIDDSTGSPSGLLLPPDITEAITAAGMSPEAPLRTNGYGDGSSGSNGFSGDATTPGTLAANALQQQWFSDISTRVLLPKFAADKKPFVLLFWSRDPDGTQHNQGDSLQQLSPGINGESSRRGLRNADHCLKQIMDWLDAHPDIKASTDVLVTSDHGFATISRRTIAADGTETSAVSSALDYEVTGKEKPQLRGTLPTGFLAVDLAIRGHMRLFDPAAPRATSGHSVYTELIVGGEHSQHPSNGSALLGDDITRIDGADARLVIAANGGSDLIYIPSKDPHVLHDTIDLLTQLDYVGGIFADDAYCPDATACPGALPLSSIGLTGTSKLPRPAIVVTYKVFNLRQGDRQTAVQISDTTLQQGQGMHGGFGRDQTFNNMAALGPDFKKGFVDPAPVGNIDIVPTLARILDLPFALSSSTGRVAEEALVHGAGLTAQPGKNTTSPEAPNGTRTVLEYQEVKGVRYLDRACLIQKDAPQHCEQ